MEVICTDVELLLCLSSQFHMVQIQYLLKLISTGSFQMNLHLKLSLYAFYIIACDFNTLALWCYFDVLFICYHSKHTSYQSYDINGLVTTTLVVVYMTQNTVLCTLKSVLSGLV